MFELNLLQFIHNMFCKNIASFAVAKYRIHVWQPLAMAKQATFLQKI